MVRNVPYYECNSPICSLKTGSEGVRETLEIIRIRQLYPVPCPLRLTLLGVWVDEKVTGDLTLWRG